MARNFDTANQKKVVEYLSDLQIILINMLKFRGPRTQKCAEDIEYIHEDNGHICNFRII